MSEFVKYDPEKLEILRSRVGLDGNIPITGATFSLNLGYSEDDNGTLMFESSTATLSCSYWDDIPEDPPLLPDDTITVHYGTGPNLMTLFRGRCRQVSTAYSTDAAANKRGRVRRADYSAELVGTYDALLDWVTEYATPAQGGYTRLIGLMTVDNESQDEPSSQLALMPVQGLESAIGRRVSAIDAMRQASSVMTMPVRESGPYIFNVVDDATEPFLPGEIELEDANSMYSQLTYEYARQAASLTVVGTAQDDPV